MTKFTSSQLRSLRNAAEGVKRVTEQLRETIYNIATEIVRISPDNEYNINIPGLFLSIEKVYRRTLGDDYDWELLDSTNAIYSRMWKYNPEFYGAHELSDTGNLVDPEHFHKPTISQIKFFVENLGAILEEFITIWKLQEAERQKLINSLKDVIAEL